MNTSRCLCASPNPECRRAGQAMTEGLWRLCQTRPDYRALWDSIDWDNLPKSPPPPRQPDGKARLKRCRHRSGRLNGTPPGGVPHRRLPPLTRVPP